MKHTLGGHRPRVRGHRKGRNITAPKVPANFIRAAAVPGQTSQVDMFFDRPVTADPTNPLNVLALTCVCGGETTRHAISVTPTNGAQFRVTLSGALTAAKTYACGIFEDYGTFIDSTGQRIGGLLNFDTPA